MKKIYVTPEIDVEIVSVESMIAASGPEWKKDDPTDVATNSADGDVMEGKGRGGWSDNGLW